MKISGSSKVRIRLCVVVGLAACGLQAQECRCGAPCDLVLEGDLVGIATLTACNTTVALGAQVTGTGVADITVGESVVFWSGFSVLEDGQLIVTLDPSLSCDPSVDADGDGVDECLDCLDTDTDNWSSCTTCTDGDGDGTWAGCDRYETIVGPDCADGDFARKPGATETCNETDDDCNGLVDECLLCAMPPTSPLHGCLTCEAPGLGVGSDS